MTTPALPDLEGCGPSQPWPRIKALPNRRMPLFRPIKALIAWRGAEGPDALQVQNLIKASIVAPDLEGCGPSQPLLLNLTALLVNQSA